MQLLQLHAAMLGHAWMASSALNSPFMHVALAARCYGDVNLGWEHIHLKKSLAELLRFSEYLLFLGAFTKSSDELPFLWENSISDTEKGNVQHRSHKDICFSTISRYLNESFNTAAFFQINSLFLYSSSRLQTPASYWGSLIFLQPAAQLAPLKEVPAGQKHNSLFPPQHMDRKNFHSSHPNCLCGLKQTCVLTRDVLSVQVPGTARQSLLFPCLVSTKGSSCFFTTALA